MFERVKAVVLVVAIAFIGKVKSPAELKLILSVYPPPLLSNAQYNEPEVVAPETGRTSCIKLIELLTGVVVFHAKPVNLNLGEYLTVAPAVARKDEDYAKPSVLTVVILPIFAIILFTAVRFP